MAKTKKADEELAQLKLALRYLAEQWQGRTEDLEAWLQVANSLHAQTLLSLLARIESLAPGSPERLIKAAVHDAKLEALDSFRDEPGASQADRDS